MKNHKSRRRLCTRMRLVLMVAVLGLVAACGDSSEPSTSAEAQVPRIAVTTGIWSDIVANVACGGIADVETIIPVGGDPHGYESSLRDRERMESAALVVANGLELEHRLEDTLAAVAASGTPVFEAGALIESIPFSSEVSEGGHGDDEGETDDHDEGEEEGEEKEENAGENEDPHVWFDPSRVSGVLGELARNLIRDAGLDSDQVESCLNDYQAELAALDAEIEELIQQVPVDSRKLVTNHDALGYFADRYGFEVIGTVIPSPIAMAETNPAQLEKLSETISHEGVKAIFAETQHSTDDAAALASRVGDVEVVALYTGSLGPPGSGAEDYVGWMRTNARLIVDALG